MEIPAWHCRFEYKPTTQNQRFAALKGGPERRYPYIYRVEDVYSAEMRAMIWAAYRQVFSEHETLKFNRQITLETRLQMAQSQSVTSFGNWRSQSGFTRWLFRLQLPACRHLPEAFATAYNKDEEIAWSITATLGFHGFVDALIDSESIPRRLG